jgi:subtilisin family serine protease
VKRAFAVLLTAALAVLSPGLDGWRAFAQVIETPALPDAAPLQAAPPAAPAGQLPLSGVSLEPGLGEALPLDAAQPLTEGLQLPASALPRTLPISRPLGTQAAVPGRASAVPRVPISAPIQRAQGPIEAQLGRTFDLSAVRPDSVQVEDAPEALPSLAAAPEARPDEPAEIQVLPKGPVEKRSALFPAFFAAGTAALAYALQGATTLVAFGLRHAGAAAATPHPVQYVVAALMGAAGTFAVGGAIDLALFSYMKWRGRNVTQEQFQRFVESRFPQYKALIRDYRPSEARFWFSYGFHSGDAVYLRRELAAFPWLFQLVMSHELEHFRSATPGAAPSRSLVWRTAKGIGREVKAYAKEIVSMRRVKREGLPLLWRASAASGVSWRFSAGYSVLTVDSQKDPTLARAFGVLSDGKAKLDPLELRGSLAGLDKLAADPSKAARYRGVMLYGAAGWLPERSTLESILLTRAFRQLELVLAQGERRRATRPQMTLDASIEKAWRHVSDRIQAVGPVRLLEANYRLLADRGVAVLPFAAGDRGLDVYERLLRFYVAKDGGRFGVTRVDLAEGGHVLVLRKLEPRINLWVSPPAGSSFPKTLTNASESAERTAEAWKALDDAGLGKYKALFAKHNIEIRHVFGADRGENRVYVSVPRVAAGVLKKLAATEPDFKVQPSQAGFQPQLYVAGPAVHLPEAHAMGYRGKGIKIAGVDTGVDAHHPDYGGRVTMKDEVNGGDGDPNGHGSHTIGIMGANGGRHVGMAPDAELWMGKVFAEGGMGASDGDIMAALSDALDWGADVINLSLGSRGGPNETLAKFVSGLTEKKNSNGRLPVIFASAGNSGPFHQVMSQPGAGANVLASGAFVRTPVQGVRLPAFFSSPGFSWDDELKIWLPKPELAGVGGNVTSGADVYSDGVESTKSAQKPASGSDAEDGKHTRMSGTSMSSPLDAGIGALVLQVARDAEKEGKALAQYVKDRSPLVVRAILMRTSSDTKTPLPIALSGLIDAEAAVKLASKTLGMDQPNPAVRLWRRAFGSRAPPEVLDWTWVDRFARILDAGRSPFEAAKSARTDFLTKLQAEKPELFPQDGEKKDARKKKQSAIGKLGDVEYQKKLAEAKKPLLPLLIGSIDPKSEPVWSNRLMAAFALMNYKEPSSAEALLEAGLNDPDARVRQMALRAIGETPGHRVDSMLKSALAHEKWDVQLYAAMALVRHGDPVGLARVTELLNDRRPDEGARVRFSAAYVAGELAASASPELAESLSARIADSNEIDSIRHHAAASITELILSKDSAVTDKALIDLVSAGGPQEMVLSHSMGRVLAAIAARDKVAARFREEPVQSKAVEFVQRYREWMTLGGPVADLVRSIAKLAGVRLDVPTPPVDPAGKGVKGVDGRLGPVQLYVRVPDNKPKIQKFSFYRDRPEDVSIQSVTAGLDPATVEKHEGRIRATLPVYNAITLEVPEAKRGALARELQDAGFEVFVARPVFASIKDTGRLSQMDKLWSEHSGENVTIAVVDEGGDASHPAFAGRVRASKNFTEEGAVDDVSSETVGHGTHVAGIAAGETADGSPYRGMAPKARIVFAKVLGSNGGTDVQVMEGQAWAASLTKDPLKDPILINESLGGPGTPEDPLSLAANKIVLGNVGFIAAAGNEGPKTGTVGSPGNAALSIAVGSVDKAGKLAFYSSREVEGKRLGGWLDYGGGAYFGRENPYEIVSALSTKLPWGDRATTVWWPQREGGKPLYQYMSGTSQAAPHTTGKLAVLVGQMLKAFGGELPTGYFLWLRSFVESKMTKTPFADHEQGAGLFNNLADISAALAQRLKDLDAIRAEAKALQDRAVREHGNAKTPPGSGSQVSIYESVVDLRLRNGQGMLSQGQTPDALGSSGVSPAQDQARASELRLVLSGGGKVSPFVFRPKTGGEFRARAAGLEGFLYSKREIQSWLGPDAVAHHAADFKSYLEALLDQVSWGEAALSQLSPSLESGDMAALDAALDTLVSQLREQLDALDPHGWIRRAQVYELFPRAYNLEGKRKAAGRIGGFAKFFDAWNEKDFDDILADNPRTDTIWLLGVWKPGERVKLGWKGSPFSIQDPLTVDPDLGTDEGLKRFVAMAHKRGLRVVLDLVPNHTSMDSVLLQDHPEYFVSQAPDPANPDAPPRGMFVHVTKDGRKLWVSHGGFGAGAGRDYWEDTAQLDYSKPEVRRAVVEIARGIVQKFGADGLRADILDQLVNGTWSRNWGKPTPPREFAAELQAGAGAAILGEAYSSLDELSAAGTAALYNKSDGWGDENAGWYDALRSRRGWQIRRAIDKAAFLTWQRGGSAGVQFTLNHDEPSEEKMFGSFWKGALILSAFLPLTRLTYAGSEVHADYSTPETVRREGPKAIPFSKDVRIDWTQKPEVREFAREANRKAAEFYAAHPDARRLERVSGNGDDWVGYIVRSKDAQLFVAANPTDRPLRLKLMLDGREIEAVLAPGDGYSQVFGSSQISWLTRWFK